MSLLTKLALGSLAAFALLRSKPAKQQASLRAARTPGAAEPARGATAPVKQARRKSAKRRAPAGRVKPA